MFFMSAFVICAVVTRAQSPAAGGPPAWAYGVTPPGATAPARGGGGGAAAPADDGSPKKISGSTQSFTLTQIRDGFNIADWFPSDHPAAPDVVMKGRQPSVRACGLCHYPNGKGRPENAGISGLPVAYFMQQMQDFRGDVRKSAESRKANTNTMIAIAKAMSDDEIKAAADYFGSMPWTPWIKVVESETVPKTRLSGGMFIPLDGTETEPIAGRIIEVPEHPDQTDLRNPRSGFVAYVPAGAINKGEALVKTGGNGRTVACGTCHGADLKGLGPVPGIAGRSPSYAARQMYDIKSGARKGLWSDLMKSVVAKLTDEDLVSISAYLASVK
jgi:cytochrome c553